MNESDKTEFITNTMDSVKERLLKAVPAMPKTWDGYELRRYITDYVEQHVCWTNMTPARRRAYNNEVAINGKLL